MNQAVKRRMAAGLVCIALAMALVAGYRLSAWVRSVKKSPAAAPSASGRTSAAIRVRVYYRGCGDTATREAGSLEGYTLDEVLREYPGARVDMAQGGGIEVSAEVDGLCPHDAPYRLVCLKDGHVVVYYGRQPLDRNLKEIRLDLPVERLSSRDVAILSKGQAVTGDDAVSRLLEGLAD